MARSGSATRPDSDAVALRCPDPCAISVGRKLRMPLMTPFTLTSNSSLQSTSVHSATGFTKPSPALRHTRSTRSNFSRTRSRSLSTSAGWRTSHAQASAFAPAARNAFAASPARAASRSAIATCMPSATHARAKPSPMPPAAPVMTATRSALVELVAMAVTILNRMAAGDRHQPEGLSPRNALARCE